MSIRIWKAEPAKRVALIDADGILFAAALAGEVDCDGEQMQILDDAALVKELHARVKVQVDWTICDKVFLVLSDRTCFRKDLLPTYKGNRTGNRPLALDMLRREIIENGSNCCDKMLVKGLEADDVCGIAAGQFQKAGYETLIVSPDKDLLQIPGMTMTPGYTKATGYQQPISQVTEDSGDAWHIYQTLVGDTVDNYKGCPGIGPKKAQDLLDYYEDLPKADRWKAVVAAFEKKGLTEEDALVQARVARILRFSDWDAVKKEVILWEPPR